MIGRREELEQLEALYSDNRFEFLVLYGRRRIGKTTILQEFAHKHSVIFYSSQEKNDALNLQDFSRAIQEYFDQHFIAPFSGWEEAFSYITRKASNERVTLIIDEFPFIVKQNPTIKSMIQHEIDLHWKNQNIFLILCGSSVSFMLNEVMGYESPLYGRITASREILPFDYYDSSSFFPGYDHNNKLIAYSILGGVPRYLLEFSDQRSITDNLASRILTAGCFLNDEPSIMLRTELREPNVYASILEAISHGYNRLNLICDHIHEESAKTAKYLKTLLTLRIVSKIKPCGDPKAEKRSIYMISDHYFQFWYQYIFTNRSYYELLGPHDSALEIMNHMNDYMGPSFEIICKQFLYRMAKQRKLPFVPSAIGRWWGTNPVTKHQDDIDILAIDKTNTRALFCECKYQNREMGMAEYDDLMTASLAFPDIVDKHYIFFSKSGYTQSVRERARKENSVLYTIDDLFFKAE